MPHDRPSFAEPRSPFGAASTPLVDDERQKGRGSEEVSHSGANRTTEPSTLSSTPSHQGDTMGKEAPNVEDAAPVADFASLRESESFRTLKRRHRRFVFPVVIGCLLWYVAYVLLAAYAHEFMSTPVFGSVNTGLILGLAQIATTFIVTTWYVSFANRQLDPIASEIRDTVEIPEPNSETAGR
jgi:uncharacterized membrane protein (DUF485 family)